MKTTKSLANRVERTTEATEVYERAFEFIKRVAPIIERELNQGASFLETVEPNVNVGEYPPRISIKLRPKSKDAAESKALLTGGIGYSDEIIRNQSRVSLIISEIAKKNGLNAKAGRVEYVGITRNGKTHAQRVYSREDGEYTLYPKYQQFGGD